MSIPLGQTVGVQSAKLLHATSPFSDYTFGIVIGSRILRKDLVEITLEQIFTKADKRTLLMLNRNPRFIGKIFVKPARSLADVPGLELYPEPPHRPLRRIDPEEELDSDYVPLEIPKWWNPLPRLNTAR